VYQIAQEFEHRARTSDFIAVVDDEGEHSARWLVDQGRRLAGVLELACERPPTVLAQADNSWRTVAATIAVGRLGGVLALVSRHATRAEFAAAGEDIRPDAVVGPAETVTTWDVAATLGGTATRYDTLGGWCMHGIPTTAPVERWGSGAVIGLTSGSTGRAKGVVQSEAALRYACSHTIDVTGLQTGDAVAGVVPLSSIAAYCFGLYLPLLLGSPVVYWHKWDPAATLSRMVERDARWTMCVPTMALQLAAAVPEPGLLRRMRAVTVGGGPMDQAALARAEKALGTRILRVFGMSECLGHTTPSLDDDLTLRLGRDGRPFPGTEVRAVDADCRRLAAGQSGRAQVRGPSLFLGYARGGAVEPPALTPDGFFPTGDLVVVHDDQTISVMGREKDVIIRGGRNIDITEVELAVASHPRVSQVCVVPVPDELLGERVAALVVSAGGRVDLAEVTRHLAERGLAKTKWPEFVFEVAAIPQTRVGKVSRPEARELAISMRDQRDRSARPATKA
jgi:acyl-CoA synthetase (AMP-forming)/AMP-acid ligase II